MGGRREGWRISCEALTLCTKCMVFFLCVVSCCENNDGLTHKNALLFYLAIRGVGSGEFELRVLAAMMASSPGRARFSLRLCEDCARRDIDRTSVCDDVASKFSDSPPALRVCVSCSPRSSPGTSTSTTCEWNAVGAGGAMTASALGRMGRTHIAFSVSPRRPVASRRSSDSRLAPPTPPAPSASAAASGTMPEATGDVALPASSRPSLSKYWTPACPITTVPDPARPSPDPLRPSLRARRRWRSCFFLYAETLRKSPKTQRQMQSRHSTRIMYHELNRSATVSSSGGGGGCVAASPGSSEAVAVTLRVAVGVGSVAVTVGVRVTLTFGSTSAGGAGVGGASVSGMPTAFGFVAVAVAVAVAGFVAVAEAAIVAVAVCPPARAADEATRTAATAHDRSTMAGEKLLLPSLFSTANEVQIL
eukprot:Rhum_TRINITY_DN14412_c5_g1::Rhum_TRINITY_DN14412_c5_g1_i1::g.87776::m.87776